MGTRSSVSIGVAVALIVLPVALLAGYGHWLATRNFRPLDVPVSLSRGHIRSRDFYVNVTGRYSVYFRLDRSFADDPECMTYGPKSVLAGELQLLRNGEVLGASDEPNYFVQFDIEEKGYYQLDYDQRSDGSCLNASHPRMVVSTNSDFYTDLYDGGRWFSLVPILGGLGLLGRVILVFFQDRLTKSHQRLILGSSDLRQGRWPPRFPPQKPISALPTFGFFCATILSLLVISFMMIYAIHPHPKGIRVLIRSSYPEITSTGAVEQPIVVRIEDVGPDFPYRLYVNSKPVPRNELESALRDELKRRPDWIVGVEADPNLPWMAVVDAVDLIKQMQARAVLLTPETSKWMRERYSKDETEHSGPTVNRRH